MTVLPLLATGTGSPARCVDLYLERVAEKLESPTYLTHAGDDRLFVTEKPGRILLIEDGAVSGTPFLDLTDRVQVGLEQGLFSMAFHPRYDENGWFVVFYSRLPDGASVVSRFRRSNHDPNLADPQSEAFLLVVPHPFPYRHHGGQLQFGPDGMLWVSLGDGGSFNDPLCHAQRRDSLLGKLLRLDFDGRVDAAPFYAIPADNPFLGPGDFPDEAWAVGLRNPWRFSFDRLGGDLYIADVGQDAREEIDFEPAGSAGGRNYGWRMMEGTACANGIAGCPAGVPPCGDPSLTPPVLEYLHVGGNCSVIGGYVYRGKAIPELYGRYLYGDYCSGRLFAASRQGEGDWSATELELRQGGLLSFGEDLAGEVYLLSAEGDVSRLARHGPIPELPSECITDPTSLCLAQERFRVRATWRSSTDSGAGAAETITADTGAFWFFDRANLELVVKVLDACAVHDRFWLFAAGLTDLEVVLEVVDTASGERREYQSAQGQPFQPIADTGAFATCP
ncbi:MAG TPA: PQQ-dependent sugar dehydrogenase [Thermoanaerobaculia bacterium]|nr:PQQ-dependent sugar dehydrogenase [Thermoanaerobaculia bacterium]